MIARHRPVTRLCRLLGVSRSGFYAWRQRPESRRRGENRQLLAAMQQIHRQVKQSYGSPRMHEELVGRGLLCGRHRVARLMRQHGLVAKMTPRFRRAAKAGRREVVAPNRLNRQFNVPVANQVWAADITYLPTAEGFVYLAVVLDLFNRQVVGWAMQDRLSAGLVAQALTQAYHRRQPSPGLLHHSDQDGLYSSLVYQHLLADYGMIASMSRTGNCLDNACVESFFASLKTELAARFATRHEAKLQVFEYIEGFYNRHRRHSSLGYLSPLGYARQMAQP